MGGAVGPFGWMVITLFIRPLCGMCAVMKQWLSDLKVAYREVDISAVPEARRILRALAHGDPSVPTLVLEDGRVLIEPARQALLDALRQRPR